jgi:hypothetical protein
MRRTLFSAPLACATVLLAITTAASATSLTRIETGPVSGAAIITEEEGVRVIRPLPPVRHLIINPDGRTPLNLTIEDRNIFVQHHYHADGTLIEGPGRFVGGYGAYVPRVYRRHHGHRGAYVRPPGSYMIRVPGAAR